MFFQLILRSIFISLLFTLAACSDGGSGGGSDTSGNGNGAFLDFDDDGIADENDTDDDNDGVEDEDDAFPLDSSESVDTDGDGIGNEEDTDDDNDGTEDKDDAFPLDETEDSDADNDGIGDNADTDDSLAGLWSGSVTVSGTPESYRFILANQGATTTVYDCVNRQAVGVFDLNEGIYTSRLLDTGDNPFYQFTYDNAGMISVEFGANVTNAINLNNANLKLGKVSSTDTFSINIDGGTSGILESNTVCGEAVEAYGSAHIKILAGFDNAYSQLEFFFRGGAATSNSVGNGVTARFTTIGSKAIDTEFTAGSIDFSTCTQAEASGSYSLISSLGVFTGEFSINNPTINVCAPIEEATIYACSAEEEPEDLTGIWRLDAFTKLGLNGLISTGSSILDALGIDLSGYVNMGLMVSDRGDAVDIAICEAPLAMVLEKSGNNLVINAELSENSTEVSVLGVTVNEGGTAIGVDVGLPLNLNFTKAASFSLNDVCMSIQGMPALPRSSITCIDKPLIDFSNGVEDSVFTMLVKSGGDIFRIDMNLGETIEEKTYNVASDDVSISINSKAFVLPYGSNTLEFDTGFIIITHVDSGRIGATLELTSVEGKEVQIEFVSKIY